MSDTNSKSSITHLAALAIESKEFESTVEITDKNGQPVCLKVHLYGSFVEGGPYRDGDFLDKPANSSKLHKGYRYIEPGLATVIREIAGAYEGAQLHPETVGVRCINSPVDESSLGYAAIAAWCEAFKAQLPSQDELTSFNQKHRSCHANSFCFDAFVKLQRSEADLNSYWHIELHGNAHTVHYVDAGMRGRTATKRFDSAQYAKKSFDRMVERKRKEGYVEVVDEKLVDRASFWQLIFQVRSRSASIQETEHELDKELSIRSDDEVVQFSANYRALVDEAGGIDVLGVAKLIGCGDSAERFHDFRRWLVLQGEEVFQSVIRDPEYLSIHDPGADPLEHWCSTYDPNGVFELVTKKKLPPDVSCTQTALPEDLDKKYATVEQLRTHFPGLWIRVHSGD